MAEGSLTYNWHSFDAELELWAQLGLKATFWWRDDDACTNTPQLETLLELSDQFEIPVSLAVVPAGLQASLPKRLSTSRYVSVLQHGYAHRNHAPATEKKSEYGDHRAIDAMLSELAQGRAVLQQNFDRRFIPVLVPPWNRYSVDLLSSLATVGYTGVSAMWARPTEPISPDLIQVNTHIDPVLWRGDRGFIGEANAMEQLVSHLRLRRECPQLGDEPTGLLSHHLDQTESVWKFCRQFASKINEHDSCCWLSAADIWTH